MKIFVNYPFFPHYRKAVIRELLQFEDVDLVLAAGCKTNADALKLMRLSEVSGSGSKTSSIEWVELGNLWLGGRVLWQKRLLSALRRCRPDVLVMLGVVDYLSCWLNLFYSKVFSVPCAMWTHGLYGREGLLLRSARLFFYKRADHVMTYGERARGLLVRGGVEDRKVTAIHNSLDFSAQEVAFRRAECLGRRVILEKYGIGGAGSHVVLFVGRLTRVKRIDLLIDAFADVVRERRVSDVLRLVIVGEGPEEERLKKLAEDRGVLDDVVFLGPIHSEDKLAELFYVADVCVSPGNVGLLAVHALGYGVPVVTHGRMERQMPEVEAIEVGRTGSFYQEGSVVSLCEEVERWVCLADDERRRVRFKARKTIAEKWSPSFQAKKIYEVCKSLANGGACYA